MPTPTVPTQLTEDYIDGVKRALADAGVTVHYDEATLPIYAGLFLTPMESVQDERNATILGWQETDGWAVTVSADGKTGPAQTLGLPEYADPADVAREVTARLASSDDEAADQASAAPAVDPITARALAALAKLNYSENYLLGYIGAGLRVAVAAHPDDDSLRVDLAMYEAWRAHQDEQLAAARARVAEGRARIADARARDTTNSERRCRDCGATSGLVMRPYGPLDPPQWECTDGCKGGAR